MDEFNAITVTKEQTANFLWVGQLRLCLMELFQITLILYHIAEKNDLEGRSTREMMRRASWQGTFKQEL